jgi:hypothetical protein
LYASKHRPYSDARFYNVATGEIEERGTPARVLARWNVMVKTFLDVEPPYLPNAHNKRVMLDYLSENQLPLNLASLKTAFAALKDKLELQPSGDVGRWQFFMI